MQLEANLACDPEYRNACADAFSTMTKYMNFEQRLFKLESVANSIRTTIITRFGLPETFGELETLAEASGATSGFDETGAHIRVALGTSFYLLDEVLAAFRFAPVTQLVQGTVAEEILLPAAVYGREDEFSFALAILSFSTLVAHEFCHLLNGHFFVCNYSKSPHWSNELAAEAQRLGMNEHTGFALETNADLAGIAWMLESLCDETSELRQNITSAEQRLPGITNPRGIGSLLAFTVVVLSKTYQRPRFKKAKHPPPAFRFETLKRTVAWYLTAKHKEAERDAFLQVLRGAVEFLLPNLRPTNAEFAEPDVPAGSQAALAHRIEQAWRDAESYLERHKQGPSICFGTEMHDLTTTLSWNEPQAPNDSLAR
jgi:hypothetical protein